MTQAVGWRKFLWKFRWKQGGELGQSFVFDVFSELCSVSIEGVDVSVELIKRTENTNKELCMGRSRVAHEFHSRNNLRRRSSRCVNEVHGWGSGGVSER